MARSAPIIPVNAAMYRHFAIATVFITGCLAMFASGENREAVEEHLAARQQHSQSQTAEQELAAKGKGGNTKSNFTDKRKVKGSFGSDGPDRWTPPRVTHGGRGSAGTVQAELVAADAVTFVGGGGGSGSGPGISGAGAAPPPGMTPEEYAQFLAQKKQKKKAAPQQANRGPTESEEANLLAASEARSQTRVD